METCRSLTDAGSARVEVGIAGPERGRGALGRMGAVTPSIVPARRAGDSLRGQRVGVLASELGERRATGVDGGLLELLLDTHELVVLVNPLAAGRSTRLKLAHTVRDGEVGD
jgi:hypothetical protein